jgi:hypothetical protein
MAKESPFPGMDPFIESPKLWIDFHNNLASEIQAQLNELFAPDYVARLTPYVTYEAIEISRPNKLHGFRPDVGVFGSPAWTTPTYAGVIDTAPVQSEVIAEASLELFNVEIRDTTHNGLITSIEILSPVNKRPGHDAYNDYLRKRRALLLSSAHLIEIDLLRGGTRPPLNTPVPYAPYYIALSRANRRPNVEVWPVQLRSRLPVVAVPLLEPDPDVALDLGTAVKAVYRRGAYFAQINYQDAIPAPELTGEEAAWVKILLAQ